MRPAAPVTSTRRVRCSVRANVPSAVNESVIMLFLLYGPCGFLPCMSCARSRMIEGRQITGATR